MNGPSFAFEAEKTLSQQIADLRNELSRVSLRLGTAVEATDDVQCAQEIAHQIQNLQTTLYMRVALRQLRQTGQACA